MRGCFQPKLVHSRPTPKRRCRLRPACPSTTRPFSARHRSPTFPARRLDPWSGRLFHGPHGADRRTLSGTRRGPAGDPPSDLPNIPLTVENATDEISQADLNWRFWKPPRRNSNPTRKHSCKRRGSRRPAHWRFQASSNSCRQCRSNSRRVRLIWSTQVPRWAFPRSERRRSRSKKRLCGGCPQRG